MKTNLLRNATVSIFLLAAIESSSKSPKPPAYWVAKDACPYEYCHYGLWQACAPNIVREKQDGQSEVLYVVQKGEKVKAITGEIHTVPGIVEVLEDSVHFDKGDRIFVYNYIAEGAFLIWYKGEWQDLCIPCYVCGKRGIDGVIRPRGGHHPPEHCSLRVLKQPVSYWWVQIECPNGKIGWCITGYWFVPVGDSLFSCEMLP